MPRPGSRAQFLHALHEAMGGSLCMEKNRIGFRFGLIYLAKEKRYDGLNINTLYVNVKQRGLGFGEYMLRHIVHTADALGIPLYLRACPFGYKKGPGTPALMAWYSKVGFTEVLGKEAEHAWMVRRPRRAGSVRLIPKPQMRTTKKPTALKVMRAS